MRALAVSIPFVTVFLGAFAGAASSGCTSGPPEDSGDAPPDAAPPVEMADAAPSPDAPPPFAEKVRSLRLVRSISVRAAPAENAPRLGTVARDIRVGWKQAVEGDDCSARWIEIEPYGWVCERYLEPSEKPPRGLELPRLEWGEMVPGVYGKVTAKQARTYVRQDDDGGMVADRTLAGSFMVRRYGELSASLAAAASKADAGPGGPPHADAGVPAAGAAARVTPSKKPVDYWLIDKRSREYLPAQDIREYEPSTFHGTRLGDDTGLSLPLGFPLVPRGRVAKPVPVYDAAEGGRRVHEVASRVPVPVLEVATAANDAPIAYRIGEAQWIRASEMRLAAKAEPPHLIEPVERWIDIDLDQQVLVAYEGELPVYATLVSTGARRTPTETGVYRTWVKFAETDMKDLAGEDPYAVATVPWTQFYAKDLALHTAYWHDKFGTPRSHGCTNLAPMDARFLYFWSDPQVPEGWSMANGGVDIPGSVIRVRSMEDPEPELRGYAKRIYEARLARQDAQAAATP